MAARTAVNPPATEVVPVTLVVGEEEFLVDRAVRDLIAAARDAAPGGDVHDLDASALSPGELDSLTSPSLFGGGCVLAVRSAQNAGKEVAAELVLSVRTVESALTSIFRKLEVRSRTEMARKLPEKS